MKAVVTIVKPNQQQLPALHIINSMATLHYNPFT